MLDKLKPKTKTKKHFKKENFFSPSVFFKVYEKVFHLG